MPLPLTLDTNILVTGVSIDPAEFVRITYEKGQPAVPHSEVVEIGVAIDKYSRVFSMDGRSVGGQIWEETDYLRFTGDVRPDQHNYAGIGTTGGGVQGEFFGSVDEGVLAVFAHNNIYWRGRKEYWAPDLQQYWNASHRYAIVVAAGKAGVLHRIGDYGDGNWAMAGQTYPREIVNRGNLLGGTDITHMAPLRLAIGAGHHNTSGGNEREHALTGPLTNTYLNTAKRWGIDVRCYTPNDGLGDFGGSLSAAAKTVVNWANQGWVPDYFLELHFQGLSGGDAGRGFFCIYPDWDSDVDVDVRDRFAPIWTAEFAARTGLPRYGNGTMSEKRTQVGIDGSRLGVFGTTAPLAATTTRMIIEHGCHTCPSDFKLIDRADFNQHCADAFMTAIFKEHGLTIPGDGGTIPAPDPNYVPSGPGFSANGFYLVKPFADFWTALGRVALPAMGLVLSGMIMAPVDSVMRYLMFTEKGAMACYPQGQPDGVAQDSEWFIRGLFPHEREEALLYAKANGLVAASVV
jgi:hypothetical protein